MDNVLILDCETTGLDPARDVCIEVACVRYSIRHRAETREALAPVDIERVCGGNLDQICNVKTEPK